MQTNFQTALQFTLKVEGGFVDDPHDNGGATCDGITLAVYRVYKNDYNLSADDLKNITPEDCSGLYNKMYWNMISGDDLPNGVDLFVFDAAVNTGRRGVIILQQCLGVEADGDLGPETLAAIQAANPVKLINDMATACIAFYRSLNTYPYFGNGWTNRVNARRNAALAIA